MAEDNVAASSSSEGCLRVFLKPEAVDAEQIDYPIHEGETYVGRGDECGVPIPAGSLSRKHAKILVEDGSHFIMDLDSRNKTFRRTVILKPNIYYELTDGVELTFANVTCHYLIPEAYLEEEDETQAYALGETGKNEGEDSDGSTVCGDDKDDDGEANEAGEGSGAGEGGEASGASGAGEGGENDEEPTQTYSFNSPKSDSEAGAPMDCEPTMAYELVEGNEGGDDDSVTSSPPLVGAPKRGPTKTVTFSPVSDNTHPADKPPTADSKADSGNDEDTQAYSEEDVESKKDASPDPELQRTLTEHMDTAPPPLGDPTVLYDLDTDTEGDSPATDNVTEASSKDSTVSGGKGAGVADPDTAAGESSKPTPSDDDTTDNEEESPVKSKLVSSEKEEDEHSKPDSPTGPVEEEDARATNRLKAAISTAGALSLMDYSEQGPPPTLTLGAGTLILPSYEESCDQESGDDKTELTAGTTVLLESYQSTCVATGETPIVEEETSKSSVGDRKEGTSSDSKDRVSSDDDLHSLIPEPTGPSKQRTILLSALGGRGKRGTKKGTRGRKKVGRAKLISEETEQLLEFGSEHSEEGTTKKKPPLAASVSVADMEVDEVDGSTLPATLKLESSTAEEIEDTTEAKSTKVKRAGSSKRGRGRGRGGRKTSLRSNKSNSVNKDEAVAQSHDSLDESPDLPIVSPSKTTKDDQSDYSASGQSPGGASQSGRGRRGRGRGKQGSTSRNKKEKSVSVPRSPSRRASAGVKPCVMFTGMIDKEGERTVRELGGELVDTVYQCTHLVTDKVRRTVKFLCCLSRGSLIVSSNWLSESAQAGHFLPAEPFLIRDRNSERQFNFSLVKSHQSAKLCKLFDNYKVYLTPNIKPQREQMADIVKCSGGEPLDFSSPIPPGDKVVIVTCEDDLSMCNDLEAPPVCSTELVLGGVLRQEIDIDSHRMSVPAAAASDSVSTSLGRKRRAKESSICTVPAAKRKRK